MAELFPPKPVPSHQTLAEAAISLHFLRMESHKSKAHKNPFFDPFDVESNWRMNHTFSENLKLTSGGKEYNLKLSEGSKKDEFNVEYDSAKFVVDGKVEPTEDGLELNLFVDGKKTKLRAVRDERSIHIFKNVRKKCWKIQFIFLFSVS